MHSIDRLVECEFFCRPFHLQLSSPAWVRIVRLQCCKPQGAVRQLASHDSGASVQVDAMLVPASV
jgi:hypothetical protein